MAILSSSLLQMLLLLNPIEFSCWIVLYSAHFPHTRDGFVNVVDLSN